MIFIHARARARACTKTTQSENLRKLELRLWQAVWLVVVCLWLLDVKFWSKIRF